MKGAGVYAATMKEATATSFPASTNRAISPEAPSSQPMRKLLVAKELVDTMENALVFAMNVKAVSKID